MLLMRHRHSLIDNLMLRTLNPQYGLILCKFMEITHAPKMSNTLFSMYNSL